MLRGLYEFRPINDKTLGFHTNDFLLFLEPHARDKNWLRVANANGSVGFVPINFIEVYRETNSEFLLSFLDESIRRAKRDRLSTLDLLASVRQNIMTSPFTTEEHVAQIDREVSELRSRAISELNYDDDPSRRGARKDAQPSRSPRRNNDGNVTRLMGQKQQQHHHYMIGIANNSDINAGVTTQQFSEVDPAKSSKSKKKKAPLAQESVQYSQVQQTFKNNSQGLVAEYVTMDPSLTQKTSPKPLPLENESEIYSVIHNNVPGTTNNGGRRLSEDGTIPPFKAESLAAELVDIVRNATGLSHKSSQDATEAVLHFLFETLDGSKAEWSKAMTLLEHLEHTPRAVSKDVDVISRSPDAKNIKLIFNRLTQCKEDEQQRSWALHEDESMILEHLRHLHQILNNADASISQFVLESGGYKSVNELVLYYQMETRWTIRARLVDCFKDMCSIDIKAQSILLNSILPMELAREIRESLENTERLCLCAGLLTMLLSSGERMPITHLDYLGSEFLEFVFNVIEDPPNQDEKITDEFMHLLFSYNLQFPEEVVNLIILTLEGRSNASVFTQKVIYFLNRGVDPVHIFGRKRNATNSVLKLTTDVFSSKRAANLFYTNDAKVLIDIVTRCVTDLCPGDKCRTDYLRLIHVMVRNSNFTEHKHRLEDLTHCFTSILLEEDRMAEQDQAIVRKIGHEFPNIFKFSL